MRVLVACEFSGTVRRAFQARGHDVVSCDLLPADDGSVWHWQGDVFDCIETLGPFDLMVAHPPCTYLTRAAASFMTHPPTHMRLKKTTLIGAARYVAMLEACAFFNRLLSLPIPRIALENPIPHLFAQDIIGPYTQTIHPWQHGHPETKPTCLWLRGLPALVPSNVVEIVRDHNGYSRIRSMPDTKDRWKKRSITYAGIAQAMADQWG